MFSIASWCRLSKNLRKLSLSSVTKHQSRTICCPMQEAFFRPFSIGRFLFAKDSDSRIFDLESNDELSEEEDDTKTEDVFTKIFREPGSGHNVFVVQPRIRNPQKISNTTPELQLAEAVTLVETLPDWKVVGKQILNSTSPHKKYVFNTGNFAMLKELIKKNEAVTAVFFDINLLTGVQHSELEKELQLRVFDRYSIVLQIFLDHARTREAKLQVALAEIPYLRNRMHHLSEMHHNRQHGHMHQIGASGETFHEMRKRMIYERERKLLKKLEKLRKRRCLLRQARLKMEYPVVAVVGYTNSGKTSLIKILTDDEKMEPKDQLFATLDVTAHSTTSVGFQKTIYMDTVGFISDIPTTLIQSFSATLEDIAVADLIIHIRDMSHPDTVSQRETVIETLKGLKLSQKLLDTTLEVGNKIDLLETMPESSDCALISATKGTGIANLRVLVEERLVENAGQLFKTLRVPTGSEASSWLYKMAGLKSIQPDPEDMNFSLMEVVLSPSILSRFKHHFGDLEFRDNKK